MKKFINLIFLALCAIPMAQGQDNIGTCGMSKADQDLMTERLLNNIQVGAQNPAYDRNISYVPIFFHLVANTAGSGRARETKVLDQLCSLNEDYASLDIQFYMADRPNYGLIDKSINSDNVYSNQSNTQLMSTKKYSSALNVYVTDIADSGNPNPIGIVLAYYSPQRDWVVSRKDQINGSGNGTLPHEIGHFFSLMHTFYGWESAPFQPSSAGWPVAPTISPDGAPTERMNGTNGTTAADHIVDTKPDYNFGIISTTGCDAYNGGAKDPLGTLVDPQENNFMGYFPNCVYEFTAGQGVAIKADLNSPQRNFLDNTFVPIATSITTPDNILVSPSANDTVDYYDNITFQWNAVTGADHYLLEVDLAPNFISPEVQTFMLTSTSQTVTNLKKSKTYYWRVRPFNQYATCAAFKQAQFKTPALSVTGVKDIPGVQSWVLQPNPVGQNEQAQLIVHTDRNINANIVLTDAAGKQITTEAGHVFPAGESNYILPINNLPNGIYFVSIATADARMTQRLVVTGMN